MPIFSQTRGTEKITDCNGKENIANGQQLFSFSDRTLGIKILKTQK